MSGQGMTVQDLMACRGRRKRAYVQVAHAEEALAATEAGMDMIGTTFLPERAHVAGLVPGTHFQFGLPWGRHADATEALRDAMAAIGAGA